MSHTKSTAASRTKAEQLPRGSRGLSVLRSSKTLDRHLQLLAIVYIRQSTPHQVEHDRESRARQYALVDYLARLDRLWQQRLQRALYEVRDAERRYRAVDPDNRLVARTLEQNWEEALRNQRQLADDYDRFVPEKAAPITAEWAFS